MTASAPAYIGPENERVTLVNLGLQVSDISEIMMDTSLINISCRLLVGLQATAKYLRCDLDPVGGYYYNEHNNNYNNKAV